MKLIEILVRELEEWPSNGCVAITQEGDGSVYFWTRTDLMYHEGWSHVSGRALCKDVYGLNKIVPVSVDYTDAVVTHSEWEASRIGAPVIMIEGISPDTLDSLRNGVNDSVSLCHFLASRSGWWTDRITGQRVTLDQVNIAEKLCLIHSEISEAMEGHRKNLNDDHLPHRKMLEVELADAVIRIGDLAGYLGLDLGGAIVEKLAYNQVRQDHKFENRQKQY